jgi:hypothetical protein
MFSAFDGRAAAVTFYSFMSVDVDDERSYGGEVSARFNEETARSPRRALTRFLPAFEPETRCLALSDPADEYDVPELSLQAVGTTKSWSRPAN